MKLYNPVCVYLQLMLCQVSRYINGFEGVYAGCEGVYAGCLGVLAGCLGVHAVCASVEYPWRADSICLVCRGVGNLFLYLKSNAQPQSAVGMCSIARCQVSNAASTRKQITTKASVF